MVSNIALQLVGATWDMSPAEMALDSGVPLVHVLLRLPGPAKELNCTRTEMEKHSFQKRGKCTSSLTRMLSGYSAWTSYEG